ncbi:MAG: aldolase/citrate lyase family protein [Chloroflexota bacterium]|nr:aldolase/citrate lyase family protein [Chloroflexota bacterium]
MKVNRTKAKLAAGETVYGCFTRINDASIIEMVSALGWDFIVFDGEHSPLEPRDAENLTRAVDAQSETPFTATPLVRVPTNQPPIILRYLDTGAAGVVVPWVNTPDEAEQVVRSVKYAPRGKRGLAHVRAADYGLRDTLGDYAIRANAETLVIVQCESVEAVENAGAIAAVDGVDVVFVGPTDLSQSMGVPGQTTHPTVIDAIQRVIDAVTPTGKAVGIMTKSIENAHFWRARGVRLITSGLDGVIAANVRTFVESIRG